MWTTHNAGGTEISRVWTTWTSPLRINNPTSSTSAAIYTCLLLLLVPLIKLASTLVKPYFSPMRLLPGPSGGSWLTGHINDINRSERDRAECHLKWTKEFGHVYVYKSLLNSDRLATIDPKALNHILANSLVYYKPNHLKLTVGQLIGQGLIFAEGLAHKRQRRVMNPSFSLSHVREMTEIFVMKSIEMRETLKRQLEGSPSPSRINAAPLISRCTLDIIGLAGFNYDFNTTCPNPNESPNELAAAFNQANRSDAGFAMMQLLLGWIPPLRWVLFDSATLASVRAQKSMRSIGGRLVREKKRELGFDVGDAGTIATEDSDYNHRKTLFATKGTGKDLLSLMIKANMSPDVSPAQRMTDEEVMHQIPTFMVAGHETTATALHWTLYSLATHPSVQQRLRAELQTISTDEPTMNQLNDLEYLDRVIKESLRIHPSFENTLRIAQADDVVPLEKPFMDRKGVLRDRIEIKKGDGIFLPIVVMNRLESIWGPNSDKFDPERWNNLPEGANSVPSVWGNQFSFLAGPRSCIGFQFAVVEMKAILFTFVRAFEFELAVSEEDLLAASAIVTRPMVRGELDQGTQMPLLIKILKH